MKKQIDLDAVTCCLRRDLPLARLAVDGIIKYINARTISVVTNVDSFPECRRVLGSDVELIDERALSGGMTLEELRELSSIEGFPRRAGWYFQQIVKLGYALRDASDGYYLIWDCDTIPLRPIEFFSPEGRALYTLADERHEPYFETYERLFGYRPEYLGSFISQHTVVNRAVAREMLGEISARHPDERSWSWAIMNNLAPIKSISLFSEYETYGNYVRSKHPDTIGFRQLKWLREGATRLNSIRPTPEQLQELSRDYYFAAFETWQLGRLSKLGRRAYNLIRRIGE